jgi:signal transduction histidine kinase/GAF domain-containing protein
MKLFTLSNRGNISKKLRRLIGSVFFFARYHIVQIIRFILIGINIKTFNLEEHEKPRTKICSVIRKILNLHSYIVSKILKKEEYRIGGYRNLIFLFVILGVLVSIAVHIEIKPLVLIIGFIFYFLSFSYKRDRPKIDEYYTSHSDKKVIIPAVKRAICDVIFYSSIIIIWGHQNPELILLLLLPIYSSGRMHVVSSIIIVPISYILIIRFYKAILGYRLDILISNYILSALMAFVLILFIIGSIVAERYWQSIVRQRREILNKSFEIGLNTSQLIYQIISEVYPDRKNDIIDITYYDYNKQDKCFYKIFLCETISNKVKIQEKKFEIQDIYESRKDTKEILNIPKYNKKGAKIIIPFFVRNQCIGITSIYSLYPYRFSWLTVTYWERFKKQFDEVIQNRALQRMLWTLVETEDFSQVNKKIFKSLEEVLPFKNALFLSWNPNLDAFIVEAMYLKIEGGKDSSTINLKSVLDKNSLTYSLITRKEPLLINDCENYALYEKVRYKYISEQLKLRSFLGISLYSNQETNDDQPPTGALVLVSDIRNNFTEEDIEFLKKAGDRIGPVLRSALRFRRIQSQLEGIWHLSTEELKDSDPTYLYKEVLKKICDIMDFTGGQIFIFDSYSSEIKKKITPTYKSIYITNINENTNIKTQMHDFLNSNEDSKVMKGIGSKPSHLFLTIKNQHGNKIGVLYLQYPDSRFFNEKEFDSSRDIISKQLTFVVKRVLWIERQIAITKFTEDLRASFHENQLLIKKEIEYVKKLITCLRSGGINSKLYVFYRFSRKTGNFIPLIKKHCEKGELQSDSEIPVLIAKKSPLGLWIEECDEKPKITFINENDDIWNDEVISFLRKKILETTDITNIALIPEYRHKHLHGLLILFDKYIYSNIDENSKVIKYVTEPFDLEDKKFIESVTTPWGSRTLANSRLWRLRLISKIVREVADAKTKNDIAEKVVNILVGDDPEKQQMDLGYAAASVSFVDRYRKKINLGAARGYRKDCEPDNEVDIEDQNSMRAFVVRKKKRIEEPNIKNAKDTLGAFKIARDNEFKAVMAIPILIGSQVTAILTVWVRFHERNFHFGDEDRAVIDFLASLISDSLTKLTKFETASILSQVTQQLFPISDAINSLYKILLGLVCPDGLQMEKAAVYLLKNEIFKKYIYISKYNLPDREESELFLDYISRFRPSLMKKIDDELPETISDNSPFFDFLKSFKQGNRESMTYEDESRIYYIIPIVVLKKLWGVLWVQELVTDPARALINPTKVGLESFGRLANLIVNFFEGELNQIQEFFTLHHHIERPLINIKRASDEISEYIKKDSDDLIAQKIPIIINNIQRLEQIRKEMWIYKDILEDDPKIKFVSFNCNSFLEQLINEDFHGFPIDFISEIDTQTTITMDKIYLKHALFYLIDNGIRFSKVDKVITLHTYILKDKNGERDYLVIDIVDKGIGITEDDLKYIFLKGWSKPKEGAINSKASTGLGLYLVSKIVEIMKGKIEVVSKVNEGSKFSLFIPIKREVKDEQKI